MWILFIVSGAILTTFAGVFFRINAFHLSTWNNVFALVPFTLLMQFFFCRAFSIAPKFFAVWFIGTAVCSICAIASTHFLFHEEFKRLDALAIALVLLGAGILARGP